MRARLRLAFVLFTLCAGCSTLRNAGLPGKTGSAVFSLSDEELKFAKALAHYSHALIRQETAETATNSLDIAAWEEVEADFSAAVELDPNTARLYPVLAFTYLKKKDYDKAIEVLNKACRSDPENVQARIDLALICEKTGRIKESIEYLKRAIKMAPKMDSLHRKLALIYFQQKKHMEAFKLVKQGIKHSDQPEAIVNFCYNLGKLYEAVGMDDMAVRFYSLAGTARTNWPDPFVRIASIYTKTDIPKALRTIDQALDTMPNEPKLMFLLGILYSSDRQFEKAIDIFQKTEKTVETPGPGGEKSNLNAAFYMSFGGACERSGQFKKAEEIFQKCLGLYPDNHETLNYLAYMWAEQGVKLDEGIQYVRKAIELDPANGAYIDTLGWIFFKQKKYQQALEQISKAGEMIKNDPTITEHLGDIYFALNDKEKALLLWQQSLVMDPTSKTVAIKLQQNGVNTDKLRKEIELKTKSGKGPSLKKLDIPE